MDTFHDLEAEMTYIRRYIRDSKLLAVMGCCELEIVQYLFGAFDGKNKTREEVQDWFGSDNISLMSVPMLARRTFRYLREEGITDGSFSNRELLPTIW